MGLSIPRIRHLLALACAAVYTHAVPHTIETPTKLLYNNDLNLLTAGQHKSVLLLPSQLQLSAASACRSLNEGLLPVNQTFFATDLTPTLQFESTFLNNFPRDQEFWVASSSRSCQTVNVQGRVRSSSCLRVLPALCSQSAAFGAGPSSNTLVNVKSSGLTITGFRDQKSFRFLGIPYANKPERFVHSTLYSGPKAINATRFGSSCVQTGNPFSSEDCLFLNIYTPFLPGAIPAKKSLKAVMLWIHGGAFTGGEASDSLFDGGNMASRGDVVIVGINYRLSTLGFLALNDGKTKGNFGIGDQITALDWVRQHITAFGGDPDRITVFGQSAGAASVRALMGSPKAIGKFAAAIQMSNLAGFGFAQPYSFYFSIPDLVNFAVKPMLAETNCTDAADTLACLKAVDPHTLVGLQDTAKFIVVDGDIIVKPDLTLDGTGPIAHVHTMMGIMRDDGSAFIGFPSGDTLQGALAQNGLPTNVTQHPEIFPLPPNADIKESNFNVSARVTTDGEFRCLDQATITSAVKHNLFPSLYYYEFNRSYQTTGFSPNFPHCEAPITATHPLGDTTQEYYKCHSGELYYVFGTIPALSDRPYRDAIDLPFMQQMVDIWTSFARTFDPNPDLRFLRAKGFADTAEQFVSQPKWDPVTKETLGRKPVRQLEWPSFMTTLRETEQCNFLSFPFTFFG
ncbi:carboxylesterase from carbohydrate esterase [Cristinia sonorae]|uniref:Carboxylic ester hydrolase n=1 Tax=Cristinia sonorae TaxID=1940300 RepID=A0A8K0UQZ8_9AGAR|nr:carboxylesterase from carbohydrate esterase [Cristinia sonorae]